MMEETPLWQVLSRWIGYVALSWATYLIYVASGVSITETFRSLIEGKPGRKQNAPTIQVIPPTPLNPEQLFDQSFDAPRPTVIPAVHVEEVAQTPDFVLNSPKKKATNHSDEDMNGDEQPNELCDPMCDPATRFHVTRCSFSIEKAIDDIKILTPEDVCPPGTVIATGIYGNELHNNHNKNHSTTITASEPLTTVSQFSQTPESSPSRLIGGDDLLVKMLCDIDKVRRSVDLKREQMTDSSSEDPINSSEVIIKPNTDKCVRFAVPDDGSDISSSTDEAEFVDSPETDDEDSEKDSPEFREGDTVDSSCLSSDTGISFPVARTPSPNLYTSQLLKELSEEALDETSSDFDTSSVLDALLYSHRKQLPTIDSPGGQYEMVYKDKVARQTVGGESPLPSSPSSPFKRSSSPLREEDFDNLLPPISPDCGYDSLSEQLPSPDEMTCSASVQSKHESLGIILEEDNKDDTVPSRSSNKHNSVLLSSNKTLKNPAASVPTPLVANDDDSHIMVRL